LHTYVLEKLKKIRKKKTEKKRNRKRKICGRKNRKKRKRTKKKRAVQRNRSPKPSKELNCIGFNSSGVEISDFAVYGYGSVWVIFKGVKVDLFLWTIQCPVAQPQHPLAGDGHGRRRARPLHRVQRRRPQAAPPRPATPCGCRRRRRQRLEASPLLALVTP
jgi:hypothetical protein